MSLHAGYYKLRPSVLFCKITLTSCAHVSTHGVIKQNFFYFLSVAANLVFLFSCSTWQRFVLGGGISLRKTAPLPFNMGSFLVRFPASFLVFFCCFVSRLSENFLQPCTFLKLYSLIVKSYNICVAGWGSRNFELFQPPRIDRQTVTNSWSLIKRRTIFLTYCIHHKMQYLITLSTLYLILCREYLKKSKVKTASFRRWLNKSFLN